MPKDDSCVQQRGEVVRLPEGTWRVLDAMHASGWLTGPSGAGVIRHLVFEAVGKWLERKDWRQKAKDLFPKTEVPVTEEKTIADSPPEPSEKPKRKIGRHERMDDIYGEVCNIGEELSGWQQPVTAEDRVEIRKMANDLLVLMDEHEKLDA